MTLLLIPAKSKKGCMNKNWFKNPLITRYQSIQYIPRSD